MSAPNLTSVITVTYFTGDVLEKSIAAVLASSVPVELVLVNNGNPPEVEAKLLAMAESEPRLKVVTGQGNVGFGRACNLGARAAKGKYLLFLNPDGLLPSDAIEKLYAEEARLKPPFMLGARLLDESGVDQRGCRRALLTPKSAFIEGFHLYQFYPKERLNLHQEPLPKKTVPMPAISGAFMFMHAESFARIHGFDEKYFLHVEDLDLCYRFRRSGGEIYFVPDVVVTHVGGTSEVTNIFLEKCKARGFIRYFHENFGHEYPQPVLWALDFCILARLGLLILKAKLLCNKPKNAAKTDAPQTKKVKASAKVKPEAKKKNERTGKGITKGYQENLKGFWGLLVKAYRCLKQKRWELMTNFFQITDDVGNPLYRLAYDDQGNKDDPCPVFCVHGLTNTRHDFDFLTKDLILAGRRVITLDLVGRGDSDRAPDPSLYTNAQYAKDCANLIFSLGLNAVDWIGISMGGLVAMYAIADEKVPVRHLVLDDVGPEVPGDFSEFAIESVRQGWSFDSEDECWKQRQARTSDVGPLTEEQRRDRFQYDHKCENGRFFQTYDTNISVVLRQEFDRGKGTDEWSRYIRIECPVLVLHGVKSVVLTNKIINKMRENGPPASFVDISDIGHYPALADAHQIGLVRDFLLSPPLRPEQSDKPAERNNDI